MSEERAAFEAWASEHLFDEGPRPVSVGEDGEYHGFSKPAAWKAWQARAASPVDAQPEWISVSERLPEFTQMCDWRMPMNGKDETWILAGECMATASVPGRFTHWRPIRAALASASAGKEKV